MSVTPQTTGFGFHVLHDAPIFTPQLQQQNQIVSTVCELPWGLYSMVRGEKQLEKIKLTM
jgi:hypothetical protein